jgi:amino acid transporter
MVVITIMYQIKFWGWNPKNWRRRTSENRLQRPKPEIATSIPRRGQLKFVDPGELSDGRRRVENLKRFGKWLLVWMK